MGEEKLHFIDSISYILKSAWVVDPILVPAYFCNALTKVVMPYIGILLPKVLIDALTRSEPNLHKLLLQLGLFGIIIVTCNMIGTLSDGYLSQRKFWVRSKTLMEINHKSMELDYQYLVSAEGQLSFQKARSATRNQESGAQTILDNLSGLVAHLVGFLLYAVTTARLNYGLVIVLCLIPVMNHIATLRAQDYENKQINILSEVEKNLEYLQETGLDYRNGKDSRLFSMNSWFESLFNSYITIYKKLKNGIALRYFSTDLLAIVLDAVRDTIAYAYLIYLFYAGQIQLGDFTLLFAALGGLSNWFTLIARNIAALRKGCIELGHVISFLAFPPDRAGNAETDACINHMMPEIVFENVSFRYPGSENWALRDVCLSIYPGEKLALVGVNGAGKTTFVKLLVGLYQPTSGNILINGHDSSAFNRRDYFKLFSVVFQDAAPLAMTLGENVSLQKTEAADEQRITDCLSLVALDDFVARLKEGINTHMTRALFPSGIELSGGQYQKLMMARALYKDAPFLVLDEPTAALDPLAESEIYVQYCNMAKEKSSLFISHRLASTRFCDRIAFIEGGRLTELGSHSELLAAKGSYAAMYEVQSRYYQDSEQQGG